MSFHNPDADIAGAILTIDLAAIIANWQLLASHHPDGRCAAVVKANAYGLGIRPVAEALYAAGCRVFFVAQPAEGVRLRAILTDREAEIHILNGFVTAPEVYLDHHLIPVLNSLGQIRDWGALCRDNTIERPADIHVDTGMSRLGLPLDEVAALAADPAQAQHFPAKYLMTHLACADMPDHPLNHRQLELFRMSRDVLHVLKFAGDSIANSSGVFLGPEFHGSILRPGIALYGVNPTPGKPNPMTQVVRLQAKILQVRTIDSPETVGYGAVFQAEGPRRIATVAVGYADGFLRSAARDGAKAPMAYVGDKSVPIVGRISMDLIGIDVSELDHALTVPGALVDLIGPHNPVDDLAEAAGTIGYEILTSLGSRYHRNYIGPQG